MSVCVHVCVCERGCVSAGERRKQQETEGKEKRKEQKRKKGKERGGFFVVTKSFVKAIWTKKS